MPLPPKFSTPPPPGLVAETFPVGLAAALLADTTRRSLSIASLLAWLRTPLKLGQALFLMSPDGLRPLGFATWAYLTPESVQRMAEGKQDLPLLEEWNEGTIPWGIDLVAPYGHGFALAAELRNYLLLLGHGEIQFCRRGRLRRVALKRLGQPPEQASSRVDT